MTPTHPTEGVEALPEFPAVATVHWPSGPVHCCLSHADQLVNLAGFLGTHVGITSAPIGSQCGNCQNEFKRKEPSHG